MASVGRHHHLDVDEQFRAPTRAVYEGVLGGKRGGNTDRVLSRGCGSVGHGMSPASAGTRAAAAISTSRGPAK